MFSVRHNCNPNTNTSVPLKNMGNRIFACHGAAQYEGLVNLPVTLLENVGANNIKKSYRSRCDMILSQIKCL